MRQRPSSTGRARSHAPLWSSTTGDDRIPPPEVRREGRVQHGRGGLKRDEADQDEDEGAPAPSRRGGHPIPAAAMVTRPPAVRARMAGWYMSLATTPGR